MNKVKEENKMLIMLAFFSISVGLWGNFRQLWLQDNNFAVNNISNILSIGTFISCVIIALIGKYVKLDKLKNMLVIVLIVKLINMIWLYTLNHTMYIQLINLSIIIDIVTEYIIITSIYPLITTIVKTETIYSKRRLTEYLFRDIGILFGGIFIGKSIGGLVVNYNICLLIANIFLLFSFTVLLNIKVNSTIYFQYFFAKNRSFMKIFRNFFEVQRQKFRNATEIEKASRKRNALLIFHISAIIRFPTNSPAHPR